ncbi:MAG: hypothetical protein IMZ47_06490, partial [Firmicutes bacterium]|nr:hypothetical protein [Bacillota bacterium]
DKDDAKREVERSPGRKVTKVEGPITSEPKDESKVSEDYTETHPGKYRVTYYDGYKEEISAQSKVDAMKKGRENYPEKRISNVKLLEENKSPFDGSLEGPGPQESISEMMTQEGIPVAGKTYHITQTTGGHWPEGDYKVTNVQYLRCVRGDLAKQFQIEGNDNWWIASFYHFDEVDGVKESGVPAEDECPGCGEELIMDPEMENQHCPVCGFGRKVEEAKKEVKPFRTIEIVRNQVDKDSFDIRVVELPNGDMMVVATEPTDKMAIAKGKEIANLMNAKFMGIVDEAKLKEQEEEETFTTVGKGMEKEDAEKLAKEKEGQVVTDDDSPEKFAVITKKDTHAGHI